MSFFLPLLYCLGLAGTTALLFRRRFEEALPLSLMAAALTVYVSGLFGRLLPGFLLTVGFAASLLPVGIVCIVRGRKRAMAERLLTPGAALFCVLYCILYVMNFDKGLVWWDEYSHWAPAVKELLRLDAFYCAPGTALQLHANYPPAIPLVEYIWCRLSGGFAEPFLYRALSTFSLSLFFPALRGLRFEKKRLSAWIGGACLLAVLLVGAEPLSQWFFSMICIDGTLGLLFAFLTVLPLFEPQPSAYKTCTLAVTVSFLVLAKNSAAVLALFALLFLAVEALHRLRDARHARTLAPPMAQTAADARGAVLRTAIALLVPAALYVSWRVTLARYGLTAVESSSTFRLFELPSILLGRGGESYQRETVQNFLRALVTTPLLTAPVSLNFVQLLCAFIALYLGLTRYVGQTFPRRSLRVLTVLVSLGALAYAVLLMVTYVFYFSPYEAVRLASYERYLCTYFTGMLAAGVMLFFAANAAQRRADGKRAAYALAALLLGLLLCTPEGLLMDLAPQITDRGVSARYADDAAAITGGTDETARVLIVSQGDLGMDGHVLSYLCLPRACDFVSVGAEKFDGDVWTAQDTPADFAARLAGYDAVYLYKLDDAFAADYGALFPADDPPENGRLYAVAPDGAGVRLTRLSPYPA